MTSISQKSCGAAVDPPIIEFSREELATIKTVLLEKALGGNLRAVQLLLQLMRTPHFKHAENLESYGQLLDLFVRPEMRRDPGQVRENATLPKTPPTGAPAASVAVRCLAESEWYTAETTTTRFCSAASSTAMSEPNAPDRPDDALEAAPAQSDLPSDFPSTTTTPNSAAEAEAAPPSASPETDSTATASPADSDLPAGTIIGGCRIDTKLGQGGMGAVYRATQVALEKPVALKVLAKQFAERPDFLERFLREARLAARLEHENIVQVFDTGVDAGHSYIVMQYVAGQTLRDRTRQGAIPLPETMKCFAQAASGLAAAHAKKVVHRDIKPENLMLAADGHLKVADFGLAQETEEIDDEDPTRGVIASAHFMSPEHADLCPVDARSDLYSLGVSFFTIFTNRRLFSGDNHIELVLKHHLEAPLPATLYRRDVPLTVSAVLNKLMQKRPADRYQSASELLDDLGLIGKRQLPRVDHPWSASSMIPPRVDVESIVKSGIKRCLEIQRAMKARGDELLSLGQLMVANNFAQLIPTGESRLAPDLPFLWPANREMPKTANPYESIPGEISLSVYVQKVAEVGAKLPPVRLTRAPMALLYDGTELSLSMQGVMRDPLTVQHFFDLLMVFPFADTPMVTLWIGQDVPLSVDDVPWLVDSHNLIRRRQGQFRVKVRDERTWKFFTGHHLDQYLEVVPHETSSSAASTAAKSPAPPDSPTSPAADSVAAVVAEPASAENESAAVDEATRKIEYADDADAENANATAPASAADGTDGISPIDEARSLLATSNPLGAKQVLMPLVATKAPADVSAEVREIAREVAVALVDLGTKCMEAEDFDEAKDWYDHAINVSPDFAEAYFHKGLALKKLGQLDSSIQFLSEAARLKPDEADYFYNRAIVRARAGQLKESIDDLNVTLELEPRHANGYYNRGIAYEKLGDFLRAKQDYQLALKLNAKLQKVLAPRLKKLEQKRTRPQNDAKPSADNTPAD